LVGYEKLFWAIISEKNRYNPPLLSGRFEVNPIKKWGNNLKKIPNIMELTRTTLKKNFVCMNE
jgi:hypothetical protein